MCVSLFVIYIYIYKGWRRKSVASRVWTAQACTDRKVETICPPCRFDKFETVFFVLCGACHICLRPRSENTHAKFLHTFSFSFQNVAQDIFPGDR